MTTLGRKLREEREKKGWKLREVVELLGLNTITTYSHWEHDRREPDGDTLSRLAELYGVSTDYLLGKTPYKNTAEEDSDGVVGIDLFFRLLEHHSDEEILKQFEHTFRGNELSKQTVEKLISYARFLLKQERQEQDGNQ